MVKRPGAAALILLLWGAFLLLAWGPRFAADAVNVAGAVGLSGLFPGPGRLAAALASHAFGLLAALALGLAFTVNGAGVGKWLSLGTPDPVLRLCLAFPLGYAASSFLL